MSMTAMNHIHGDKYPWITFDFKKEMQDRGIMKLKAMCSKN